MNQQYDQSSEIYSFSIVLWEMMTLQRPYDTVVAELFHDKICVEGMRPKLSDNKRLSPAICTLLRRCWDPTPSLRPHAHEIVDEMMQMIAQINSHKQGNLSNRYGTPRSGNSHRSNPLLSSRNEHPPTPKSLHMSRDGEKPVRV